MESRSLAAGVGWDMGWITKGHPEGIVWCDRTFLGLDIGGASITTCICPSLYNYISHRVNFAVCKLEIEK